MVKNLLENLLQNCNSLSLKEIDITKEIDKAHEYDIIALPTIILPNNERIVGAPDEELLKQQLQFFCLFDDQKKH